MENGITSEGEAKGGYMGKGPRHTTVGESGKFGKMSFKEGRLPVALTWKMLVLLPKGGREYRGIGLVEVVWKVCTSIMKYRLRSAITLHDALSKLYSAS